MENLIEDTKKQIDFYFGDSNLQKDRFLAKLIGEDEEGWVDVSVIANFNKIKQLAAKQKTNEVDLTKKAIKKSTLLQLSEDSKRVKRIKPFVEISKQEIDERTIYVENFPSNFEHNELSNMFGKVGEVAYVSVPRFEDRSLKGFAFIEFTDKNSVQKALKLNEYNSETNPKAIRVMEKQQWLEMRRQYQELLNQQTMKDQEVKKRKREAFKQENGPKYKAEKETVATVPMEEDERKEGVLVEILHVDISLNKQKLKEAVTNDFPVAYVDYKPNTDRAVIRCFNAEEAQKLIGMKKVLRKSIGEKVKLHLLKGDAEKEYWDLVNSLKNVKEKKKQKVENAKISEVKKDEIKPIKVQANVEKVTEKPKHKKFEDL